MKTFYQTITLERARQIARERTQRLGGDGIKFDYYSARDGFKIIPVMMFLQVEQNQEAAEKIKPFIKPFPANRTIDGLADETGLTLQQVAQGMKWLIKNLPYTYTLEVNRNGFAAAIHQTRR